MLFLLLRFGLFRYLRGSMGRTSTADWRQARLPFLRGLAKPSALQRLLLDLIAHPGRTPKQDRQLESLWKAERADDP